MKVYLLNPPFKSLNIQRGMRWIDSGRGGTYYQPVFLAYATGMLEQAGFECRLIDAPARKWDEDGVLYDILHYRPDFIVIDTSFPTLWNDLLFAAKVRSLSQPPKIIMVGTPMNTSDEMVLNTGNVDYVCRLEYDFVLRDLLVALRDDKTVAVVRGISYVGRDGYIKNSNREWSTTEELDDIPYVSKVYQSHLNVKDYMLNYSHSLFPNVQILTSRGCGWGRCKFCNFPANLTGRVCRSRSVENIIGEFIWIEEHMKDVKQIFIEDDAFTIDKEKVLRFCGLYYVAGLKIPWGAQSRITIDAETMQAMKTANCSMIDVGYESGDDGILKTIDKGTNVDMIRRFANDASDVGLSVHGNWIIGLPGETRDTIRKTWELIKETKSDAITVAVCTPFPGTEMYDLLKSNIESDEYLDEYGHQRSIVSYPHLSAEEIKHSVDWILRHYYLSPSYVPIALRRVTGKNGANEIKVLGRSAMSMMKYLAGSK